MCVLYCLCCLCIREHRGPVFYVENSHEPRKRTSPADFLEAVRRASPRGSGSPREWWTKIVHGSFREAEGVGKYN